MKNDKLHETGLSCHNILINFCVLKLNLYLKNFRIIKSFSLEFILNFYALQLLIDNPQIKFIYTRLQKSIITNCSKEQVAQN